MPRSFRTILIDPPWPESGGGRIKRGADRHYPLVKVRDIPGVILGSGVFSPADDAHLYLWATNNYLGDALAIIPQLGFRYVTCITWAKPGRPGLGQYFRGQTEHLLFAVRGDGMGLRRSWTPRRDLSTYVLADRPRDVAGKIIHSAKPNESYELVEAASPPPRLEMFARRRRRSWTSWGNEL
jgi:N6-adenosine-specific RNA methylase IME4